jgi:hypothetical protein
MQRRPAHQPSPLTPQQRADLKQAAALMRSVVRDIDCFNSYVMLKCFLDRVEWLLTRNRRSRVRFRQAPEQSIT